jgi:hypothetical protein
MAVTNVSFIEDQGAKIDNWELWYYLEISHIHDLVTPSESARTSDASLLVTTQLDRIVTSLNWGTSICKGILSEKYNFSGIIHANCGSILKSWTARLAQYDLERRRYRSAEQCSEKYLDISADIENYAKERTPQKLDIPRGASPLGVGFVNSHTQFDNAGQFDKIIPDRESEASFADGYGD